MTKCLPNYDSRARDLLVADGYLTPLEAVTWPATRLGGGWHADVYALGDQLVAKITGDADDATAAWHVRGLQRARYGRVVVNRGPAGDEVDIVCRGLNVVRVHAVYELANGNNGRRFLVVSERLDPLPPELRRLANMYNKYSLFSAQDVVSGGREVCAGMFRYVDDGGEEGRHWIAAALNAVGIRNDLIAAGVTEMTDWHAGNIMWRPASRDPSGHGRVVLSDLGCSSSWGRPMFDVPRCISPLQNAA